MCGLCGAEKHHYNANDCILELRGRIDKLLCMHVTCFELLRERLSATEACLSTVCLVLIQSNPGVAEKIKPVMN